MAVAAPQVRSTKSLISELNKGTQAQRERIQADIGILEQGAVGQRAGLEAQKDLGFEQIEQGAQNKNMLFSGVPVDEQAKYLSTHYLPALTALEQSIAQGRSNLLGKQADLDADVFGKAFTAREGDVDRVFTDAQRRYTEQFQARESEIQRLWQSGESDKARAAERELAQLRIQADKELEGMRAANTAANTRLQAELSAAKGPDVQAIKTDLFTLRGKDGRVHPDTWNRAMADWVSQGGDPDDFNTTFNGVYPGVWYNNEK